MQATLPDEYLLKEGESFGRNDECEHITLLSLRSVLLTGRRGVTSDSVMTVNSPRLHSSLCARVHVLHFRNPKVLPNVSDSDASFRVADAISFLAEADKYCFVAPGVAGGVNSVNLAGAINALVYAPRSIHRRGASAERPAEGRQPFKTTPLQFSLPPPLTPRFHL